jgi:hypothetical protein
MSEIGMQSENINGGPAKSKNEGVQRVRVPAHGVHWPPKYSGEPLDCLPLTIPF